MAPTTSTGQSLPPALGIPILPINNALSPEECTQLNQFGYLGSVNVYLYPICQPGDGAPLAIDCTQQGEGVGFSYSAEYTEVPSQCKGTMSEYLKRNSIELTIGVNYLGFKDLSISQKLMGLSASPENPSLLIQDCASSFKNRYFSILLLPSGNAPGDMSGGMIFPWARYKFGSDKVTLSIDEAPKYTHTFICTCSPIPKNGKQDFLVGYFR